MLIRRSALDEVGLFDEGYWLYMEDLDLCYRFAQAGWVTWYEPSVAVTHVKGGTSGRNRTLRVQPRVPLRDVPLLPPALRARTVAGLQRRGLRRDRREVRRLGRAERLQPPSAPPDVTRRRNRRRRRGPSRGTFHPNSPGRWRTPLDSTEVAEIKRSLRAWPSQSRLIFRDVRQRETHGKAGGSSWQQAFSPRSATSKVSHSTPSTRTRSRC